MTVQAMVAASLVRDSVGNSGFCREVCFFLFLVAIESRVVNETVFFTDVAKTQQLIERLWQRLARGKLGSNRKAIFGLHWHSPQEFFFCFFARDRIVS